MKMKTIRTSKLKYAKRVRIMTAEYADGSLYVGILTMSGEDYCDITTNLSSKNLSTGDHAYVQCDSEAEAFILEQMIALPTMAVRQSGFNTYRLYDFTPLLNDPAMKEVD
jgi:hypothetical protein